MDGSGDAAGGAKIDKVKSVTDMDDGETASASLLDMCLLFVGPFRWGTPVPHRVFLGPCTDHGISAMLLWVVLRLRNLP